MNKHSISKYVHFYLILAAVFCLTGLSVAAQERSSKGDFCRQNNWSDNKRVSFGEAREMTMPAANLLTVDGKRNGGISIIGENRADIAVKACVQAWAETDAEARSLVAGIRIEKGANVYAENSGNENNWSVSYEVRVPFQTDLKLTAYNGGLIINSVEGDLEFSTKNGGIILKNVAGDVKGRTTNGGIIVDLAGNSWKGNGLDVETTNGGVILTMSENYAARIETGTVNGGFNSEIQGLTIEKKAGEYYQRNKRINTDLNGGGATIRLITTNGGIKINKD